MDCSASASASPEFCDRFPEDGAIAFVQHVTRTCTGRGLPNEACLKTLRWIANACREQPRQSASEAANRLSAAQPDPDLPHRLRVGPIREPFEDGAIDYLDVMPPGFVLANFDRSDFQPFSIDQVILTTYQLRDDGSEIENVYVTVQTRGNSNHQLVLSPSEPGDYRITARAQSDGRLLAVRSFSLRAGAPTTHTLPQAKSLLAVQVGPGSGDDPGWKPLPQMPTGQVSVIVTAGAQQKLGTTSLVLSLRTTSGDDQRVVFREPLVPTNGELYVEVTLDAPGNYTAEVVDPVRQMVVGTLDFDVMAPPAAGN